MRQSRGLALGYRSISVAKMDRLVLKTMGVDSRQAQISGGKAACHSQRVEDNAFHLSTSGDNPPLLAARFNGGDFGEIWREIVCVERLDIHFD